MRLRLIACLPSPELPAYCTGRASSPWSVCCTPGCHTSSGSARQPGNQHRKQRKMLNPAFSTAHMRDMLPTFYSITYKARSSSISPTEPSSHLSGIYSSVMHLRSVFKTGQKGSTCSSGWAAQCLRPSSRAASASRSTHSPKTQPTN